jgi:hypothetical protein
MTLLILTTLLSTNHLNLLQTDRNGTSEIDPVMLTAKYIEGQSADWNSKCLWLGLVKNLRGVLNDEKNHMTKSRETIPCTCF